ncbi:MAG: nucleotide pyrophosphohydrolase [Saprospiraceae bacterium]|jgi:NTP pyrophosphatase (non-canonical NTP hydrolase)
MTIRELQQRVDSWISEYGVRYFNVQTNTLLLVEEVGELTRLIARKYGEQSFKKEEDRHTAEEQIKNEIGDILFVLTCLSNQMELDMENIMLDNMDKKTQRDKERHRENKKLMD